MSELPTYPFADHREVARSDNLVVLRIDSGHLCGYAAFPDADVPPEWRGTYHTPGMQFLRVHGGMTYANNKNGWSVYGFDCAHSGDEARAELHDPAHVLALAGQMQQQLLAFRNRWPEFITADREGRCAILDAIRSEAGIQTEAGLGEMLEMMAGAPSLGAA